MYYVYNNHCFRVFYLHMHFFSGDSKDETYTSEKNRNSGYETNLYLYNVSTEYNRTFYSRP